MPSSARHDPRLERRRVAIPLPSDFAEQARRLLGDFRSFLGEDALWLETSKGTPNQFFVQAIGTRWRVGYTTGGATFSDERRLRLRALNVHLTTTFSALEKSSPEFTNALRPLIAAAPARDPAVRRVLALRDPDQASPHASLRRAALMDVVGALADCEETPPTPGSPLFAVWRGLLGEHQVASQTVHAIAEAAASESTWRFAQMALLAIGDEVAADAAAIAAAEWMDPIHAAHQNAATAENLARRGDFSRAWACALNAVKTAPKNPQVIVDAATAFELIGAFDEVQTLLERVLALEPQSPEGHLGLMRLALWRGDHKDGLRRARDVQERFPDRIEGYRGEAIAHFLAGDHAKALAAVDVALQLVPNDPETLLWRAGHRIQQREFDGALDDIQASSLAIQWPTQGILHALLLALRGDDIFEILNHPSLRDNFHDGLFTSTLPAWLGEERQARAETSLPTLIQAFEGLIDEMAGNRTALATRVERSEGKPRLEPLPAARRSRSESGNALKLLRTHPVEAVLEEFDTLLARYPSSPHPWCYRGELWLWLGDYERAMADFDEGLRDIPVRWGFVGKAAIHILRNNIPEADHQLARCSKIFDAIPGATTHVYVGELRRRQGRFEEAEYELMEALRAKPHRHAARMNLALALSGLGRHEEAADAWRTVWSAIPGLLWDAGRLAGIPAQERVAIDAMPVIVEQALTMMRGNRSSHLITYFVDDQMRIAPDVSKWGAAAVEGLDAQEELMLAELFRR